jgi:hypothetical protein
MNNTPWNICVCGKPLWAGTAIRDNGYQQVTRLAIEHTDRTKLIDPTCQEYARALPEWEQNALLEKPGAAQVAKAEQIRKSFRPVERLL